MSRWSGTGTTDGQAVSYQLPIHPFLTPKKTPLYQTLLYVKGHAYLQVPFFSLMAPGKRWIDLGSIDGATLVGIPAIGLELNPLTIAQLLSGSGYKATALAKTKVAGTSVAPYKVSMSSASVQSRLRSAGAPASVQQAVSAMLGSSGLHAEISVSDGGAYVKVAFTSSVTTMSGVHAYGQGCLPQAATRPVPVVSRPKASQTLTYAEYLRASAVYQRNVTGKG